MIELDKIILSVVTLLLFIFMSFVAIFLINKLANLTSKRFSLNTKIVSSLKTPLRLIIILIGTFISIYYVQPDFKINGFSLILIYKIISVLVLTYACSNIIKAFFIWYIDHLKLKNKFVIDNTIFYFLMRVFTIIMYLIGLLIILSLLKIEIKPLLTGLGIAGLAVALALQDTLGNFFSAVYIAIDQPVKIGDYIELSTGERGYIFEIGWRSTRLKNRENNIIIIPNSKLAQSVIINFNQIQTHFKVEIPLGVSYSSDLDLVEKITLQTAKSVMKTFEPKITSFEPFLIYENFGDSSINFKLHLMTENIENKAILLHNVIKELHKAYRRAKIEIPYPQRDVHLKK